MHDTESANFHLSLHTDTTTVVDMHIQVCSEDKRMESYSKSFNQSSFSNDTHPGEISVLATYLSMIVLTISAIMIATPALMIINVIWQTRNLHTKYFLFLAHLLAIDVADILGTAIGGHLIMCLYLFDFNLGPANILIKWLVIFPNMLLFLASLLAPINLAVERMIAIAFPYRHRSIMTNKKAATMLAAMWGVSTISSVAIIITVPYDIIWRLALFVWDIRLIRFTFFAQITSIVSIVVANVFLQYKITISNRIAKENERLGNEEEVKRFRKFVQEIWAQAKATITLFLVGGIDVMANILLPAFYIMTATLLQRSQRMYVLRFSMIETCFHLSQI